MTSNTKIAFALLLLSSFSQEVFAIAPVPSTTQPGVISNFLSESLPRPSAPRLTQGIQAPEGAVIPYDAEAAKIDFVLTKVILEGNTVYSDTELSELYKDKVGKKISVLEFKQIVQDITNYYRNNGYILSRAIIPPQTAKGGVVHVRIIEGFIDDIKLQGEIDGAGPMLRKYGQHITDTKPLQLTVLNRYLLLSNDLPGVQVQSVLEPSEETSAASTMTFAVKQQRYQGYLSYDDYGTRYLGPHQVTANVTANSFLSSGDSLRVTYLETMPIAQLRYMDGNYQIPIGTDGMEFDFDANKALTNPGFVLTELENIGNAVTYYASLQYPVIRASDRTLMLDGGAVYYNSILTALGFLLYDDNVRSLRMGGTYSFSDSYKGVNQAALHYEQGFPVLGATENPDSLTTSRFGATGVFSKFVLQYNRNQALFDRFSAFIQANGQYSFNPVLSYEQFAYGGPGLGRGYDPAEIIGDSGLAGSLELRMDVNPQLYFAQAAQFYIFYDAGVVWNIKDLPGSYIKQSATSAGSGLRMSFNQNFSGNVMIAQPLTKQVSAEEIVGQGKMPRVFFSLVASV